MQITVQYKFIDAKSATGYNTTDYERTYSDCVYFPIPSIGDIVSYRKYPSDEYLRRIVVNREYIILIMNYW